jgi:HPt (histidine-containing phosphotransfer) domain-containing protein
VAAADAQAVSQAAHALKGACSNVGAVAMLALCAGLEADTLEGAVPVDAGPRVRQLAALWPATREALANWLPPPAP